MVNILKIKSLLDSFDFTSIFVNELGWSHPKNIKSLSIQINGMEFSKKMIAELAGVAVFEISSSDGSIPDARTRASIYKEIVPLHHENILIFVDKRRAMSLWYWVKRIEGKLFPRDHIFVKGQPGDLFLSKIKSMVFDISDFDDFGNVSVLQVTSKLKDALDVEKVTKRFFNEFQEEHVRFIEYIEGIDDEKDRKWYASILLNRLMFIYFLQRKLFLDNGNEKYLQNKLEYIKSFGKDLYYEKFLKILFFEGFAKPEDKRNSESNKLLGNIKYLNGGLFLEHRIETSWRKIKIKDKAFENIFSLFERYSWNLNDTPGGKDNEINPDVLGYIFEKYINQKAFGAYYTCPEITEYLCERTINRLVLEKAERAGKKFDSIGEMLIHADEELTKELLLDFLPKLSLLDPACGSGAFLVAAMKTLINLYSALIGKIEFLQDQSLKLWIKKARLEHPSIAYFIKKKIITDNLYGVDIMEEAVEIAKLRLFLALVASASKAEELEPLPNIDFNILSGNSLIGLMKVDDKDFENKTANIFRMRSYKEILDEKNKLIDLYRHASMYAEDLKSMRDSIENEKKESSLNLNEILHDMFWKELKIKFEEATWDDKKNSEGKTKKRNLEIKDIEALKPFHWGYEFDRIINKKGGFDAIITNPPWEILKPNAKEFFEEHSELVTKKKMTIKEFEKEQKKLLKDPEIRKLWLEYLSQYPHVSEYFRTSPQYKNQISIVNGKKAGTDINLYKLFTEQCFNLLRDGGCCGIVIPSGIYTDLGTKQLREMLFNETAVTGLFCFENRKGIFENVDSRFKFVVLSFEKGGKTADFPAAFMRHHVKELERFPREGAINISVDLVKKLSPDSLSVMEFKNETDIVIAKKMMKFPLLGEKIEGTWNLKLGNEFHMTNDSYLFKTQPGKGRLPLYEGKMIHQFVNNYAEPKYWIDEKEGRKNLVGREEDNGQKLDYQEYRLGFRAIARNTDERTIISGIISKNVFCGNSLLVSNPDNFSNSKNILITQSFANSFVLDSYIRKMVTANINMFYIYQLPVPRLIEKSKEFKMIVERAAKLICTTPEFDDLAKEVGLGSHKNGVTDPSERRKLRAELDGIIGNIYGLTEEEFVHVLSTFPIVGDDIKLAAHNAFRNYAKGLIE